MAMTLSPNQLHRFHEDGYLLIENFLTDTECDSLKDACHRIIKDADFSDIPKVIFDTVQHKQATEEYFIRSADKVRFFFEEGVFTEDGKLNCPKEKSLHIKKCIRNLSSKNPEIIFDVRGAYAVL